MSIEVKRLLVPLSMVAALQRGGRVRVVAPRSGYSLSATAGCRVNGDDVNRRELVIQLGRLRTRREFLSSQRAEATKQIEDIDREEQRLRRNVAVLDRGEEVSA